MLLILKWLCIKLKFQASLTVLHVSAVAWTAVCQRLQQRCKLTTVQQRQ